MFALRLSRATRFLALSVVAAAISHAGIVTVTPVVTPNGGLFHYDYSIANQTGNDLAVLDIAVTPGPDTVVNLVSPLGFLTAYDAGLGLVSFLEDSGTFGASPLSGFAFDSRIGLGSSNFTATFFDGTVASGPTGGPTAPEPASTALFAAAGVVFLGWRVRQSTLRL